MKRLMNLVMLSVFIFVVLTLLGMIVYRGGTGQDPATEHYLFFQNFFSDLGLTVAHNGQRNLPSALLFAVALTMAGAGLMLFFVGVTRIFRERRLAWLLSLLGTLAGLVAGVGYVGVAFTPANLYLDAHISFVYTAFLSFFIAVLFYLPAVLLSPRYPNQYAVVYLAFALLLAGYLFLLFNGPDTDTATGLLIQATGQKIIVYAALITIFIQAWAVKRIVD